VSSPPTARTGPARSAPAPPAPASTSAIRWTRARSWAARPSRTRARTEADMATIGVTGEFTVRGEIMKRSGWSLGMRALRGGAVAALFLLVAGDRSAQTSLIGGTDPLAILKLQVKNNV